MVLGCGDFDQRQRLGRSLPRGAGLVLAALAHPASADGSWQTLPVLDRRIGLRATSALSVGQTGVRIDPAVDTWAARDSTPAQVAEAGRYGPAWSQDRLSAGMPVVSDPAVVRPRPQRVGTPSRRRHDRVTGRSGCAVLCVARRCSFCCFVASLLPVRYAGLPNRGNRSGCGSSLKSGVESRW